MNVKLKIYVKNVFGKVIPKGSKVKVLIEEGEHAYIVPEDREVRGAWVKKDDVQ